MLCLSSTKAHISYVRYGQGPPLVLVHGGFSNHETNWEFVKSSFEKCFTVYAIARRGRGDTDTTEGHSLEEECHDLTTLIRLIAEPIFLLGHSYGAQVALAAAAQVPELVRKLVLYEPPWPHIIGRVLFEQLEVLAQARRWDDFSTTFFRDGLRVPVSELEELRRTEHWPPIVSDAKASLGDLRALSRYHFDPKRFRDVQVPVLLQVGSESPRDLYVTDALADSLPKVRVEELSGQAHEGMTTAPELYAESVKRFLLK